MAHINLFYVLVLHSGVLSTVNQKFAIPTQMPTEPQVVGTRGHENLQNGHIWEPDSLDEPKTSDDGSITN